MSSHFTHPQDGPLATGAMTAGATARLYQRVTGAVQPVGTNAFGATPLPRPVCVRRGLSKQGFSARGYPCRPRQPLTRFAGLQSLRSAWVASAMPRRTPPTCSLRCAGRRDALTCPCHTVTSQSLQTGLPSPTHRRAGLCRQSQSSFPRFSSSHAERQSSPTSTDSGLRQWKRRIAASRGLFSRSASLTGWAAK